MQIYASIDSVPMALLFFYIGYLANKLHLQERLAKISSQSEIIMAVALYGLYLLLQPTVVFRDNHFPLGYLASVIGLTSIVMSLFILSYVVVERYGMSLKMISYCGVNSLVILCSHHLIYRPVEYGLGLIGMKFGAVIFAITISLSLLAVYMCNKYLPILAGKIKK